MRRWELWGGSLFFASDNDKARQMARDEGYSLEWTCWACGYISAQQQRHRHLGYSEYQPMLRGDGTPYPEDLLDWKCAECGTYFGPGRRCPSCGAVTQFSEPGESR